MKFFIIINSKIRIFFKFEVRLSIWKFSSPKRVLILFLKHFQIITVKSRCPSQNKVDGKILYCWKSCSSILWVKNQAEAKSPPPINRPNQKLFTTELPISLLTHIPDFTVPIYCNNITIKSYRSGPDRGTEQSQQRCEIGAPRRQKKEPKPCKTLRERDGAACVKENIKRPHSANPERGFWGLNAVSPTPNTPHVKPTPLIPTPPNKFQLLGSCACLVGTKVRRIRAVFSVNYMFRLRRSRITFVSFYFFSYLTKLTMSIKLILMNEMKLKIFIINISFNLNYDLENIYYHERINKI